MAVPPACDPAPQWTQLDAEAKRERVLEVAQALFAREGVGFPMPELAAAVGVGVGSLYRQVGKKDDVIAALVVRRAAVLERRFAQAAEQEVAFPALCAVVLELVAEGLADRSSQEAWSFTAGRDDVQAARERLGVEMDRLVAQAHAQGALRPGVEAIDLGLALTAARAAEALQPGGGERLARRVLAGVAAAGQPLPPGF